MADEDYRKTAVDKWREKWTSELTDLQRKFVEKYCGEAYGNAQKAAEMAGYGDTLNAGKQNMLKTHILRAIADLNKHIYDENPEYISPEDVQRHWKRIVEDPNVSEGIKRRVLNDIARANGMYIDKMEITGRDGTPISIDVSNMTEEEIEEKLQELSEIADE